MTHLVRERGVQPCLRGHCRHQRSAPVPRVVGNESDAQASDVLGGEQEDPGHEAEHQEIPAGRPTKIDVWEEGFTGA
jgi:hypothetical protein